VVPERAGWPRLEGHAPGRVECRLRWWGSAGGACPGGRGRT